jgi:UDP-glucuronate decarboxylase
MRILVTGGAGFLGSHLCEKLLANGYEVIALDNMFTGSESRILDLQRNSNFKMVVSDVIDPLDFEVDSIFNFACPASPIHYQKYPIHTMKTNVLGSINVLNLANKLGVPIVQASTSEVYGDPMVTPQKEEYWGNVNPIGVRSCYDEGKRAAESLFFDSNRQFGTKIKVARIFNTYGPKMSFNDGRVVSNFIIQALKNEPITIYGDGKQTRSFCYVSDLINGIIKLFHSSPEIIGPINLGNPTEFTMLEVAEMIISLTDSKSPIIFKDLPSDDPRQRKPDISIAKKTLDWFPEVSLDIGLKLTIEDFRSRL